MRRVAKTPWIVICVGVLLFTSVACDREKSSIGFRLPDGDPAQGRANFERLACHTCHRVTGQEFETEVAEGPVTVTLGGETSRVRSYGELVTSIINPSHRIARMYDESRVTPEGESRMANYNEVLTVQELIDLVAFLQDQYEVVPPAYEYYGYTYGP